jgi:hypothetical protein
MKKQGRSDRDVKAGGKPDPVSYKIGVGAVSNIGIKQFKTQSQELYQGRGFASPPMKARTTNRGSQGKH